jgi:FkbM family methyltransferase
MTPGIFGSRAWLRVLKRTGKKRCALPAEVEAAERAFYLSYLKPGMVAFDVGAFRGDATLLFSKAVQPTGSVHAFEATEASFGLLKTNCAAAQCGNVVLNHCAVCGQDGTVTFNVYDSDHLSWSSLANRPLEKYGIDIKPAQKVTVPAVTIDTYCTRQKIEAIDLLKLDVEGAEYQAMQGAERMLQSHRIACCAFEFGQTTFDMGNTPADIQRFLERMGYEIRNIVPGDPLFPGGQRAGKAEFSMHLATPVGR